VVGWIAVPILGLAVIVTLLALLTAR